MVTIWREENIITLHATKNHNEDIMIIAKEKWSSEMWSQSSGVIVLSDHAQKNFGPSWFGQ